MRRPENASIRTIVAPRKAGIGRFEACCCPDADRQPARPMRRIIDARPREPVEPAGPETWPSG